MSWHLGGGRMCALSPPSNKQLSPSTLDGKLHMEQDTFTSVEGAILTIGGQRVILDEDLARLYGVSTKRLNEQVK
jgi:hypothetical protein